MDTDKEYTYTEFEQKILEEHFDKEMVESKEERECNYNAPNEESDEINDALAKVFAGVSI